MDISNLLRIEYHGERVLTSKQLAKLYRCAVQQIRQNFSYNKAHFVEGVHYFKLEGAALREFKAYLAKVMAQNNDGKNFTPVDNDSEIFDAVLLPCTKMASSLFLWTKEGVIRHCKMLGTNEAWKVFNELEKSYFENAAEPTLNRVYAMELSDGTVKIGRSSNIEVRQKQIESENGVKVLRVYYTDFLPLETAAQIETDCHKFFAEFLARGKEFFNVSFEDACAAIDNFSVPPQFETPALDFSPREKVETLKFLIERCQDENLRDELIKSAYEILIAR